MSEQNKLTADELSSYLTHLDVRTGSKVRKHVAALELEIEQQLEAAKQREATLHEIVSEVRAAHRNLRDNDDITITKLTLERDAALNALGVAREALKYYEEFSHQKVAERALAKIADPAAALAERDRVIERKTAERCIELIKYVGRESEQVTIAGMIRRKFSLDANPEDKQ